MFKNSKKSFARIGCLILALMLCITAAGCGEKETESGSTGGDKGGITANEVDKDWIAKSKVANKMYDGESFRMLYTWEPGEVTERMVDSFNAEHDANIEIVVDTGSIYETLATAIASGTPYDIVCTYDKRFPNIAIKNLLEPLENYYTDVDLYDSTRPKNGGINKQFIDFYTMGGHSYLVGSSNSVYQQLMFYNKKMFVESGLEDPWELYKAGNWTWDKFMEMGKEVTNVSEGISFTSFDDIWSWLTLNCIDVIKRTDGDNFVDTTTDATTIEAVNQYRDLYYGKEPICLRKSSFEEGTSYTSFLASNAYSTYATIASGSSAFGKKATNLGAVPVPMTTLNKDKKYPAHGTTGYAVCKGAKDPTIAICYALFESRAVDVDNGEDYQLNPEINSEAILLYNNNPSLLYSGFGDTNGVAVSEFYRDTIGKEGIHTGADATSTLNNYKSVIKRMITDSLTDK